MFFGFGVSTDVKKNGFQVVQAIWATSRRCAGLAFAIEMRRITDRGGPFGTWRPAVGSSQGAGGQLQFVVVCF